MAVNVRTTRTEGGVPVVDTHPEGERITVSDGHLVVSTRYSQWDNVEAIYAPGQWVDATSQTNQG